MADRPARQDGVQLVSPLRTPRAAALAGIVFSVLLIVVLVLLRVSTLADPAAGGPRLAGPGRRTAVTVGLNLVPFAGIAFLWFIGVVRDRIGRHEDRFFATVFLGSGLLFVAMLFAAAAVAGGLLAVAASQSASGAPSPNTLALGRSVTSALLNIYSMRMAAVFTLTTVTIGRRIGMVARWLGATGILTALVLLIGVSFSPWLELLFPAWILALSIDILAAGASGSPAAAGSAPAD